VVDFVKQTASTTGTSVDRGFGIGGVCIVRLPRQVWAAYHWLQVEYLPGVRAGRLNPVEAIWNHTKYDDPGPISYRADADDLRPLDRRLPQTINAPTQDLKYSCFRYAQVN